MINWTFLNGDLYFTMVDIQQRREFHDKLHVFGWGLSRVREFVLYE